MWKLPNGKILISGGEFTPFLHYIEKPNEVGVDCHFNQRVIEFPEDPLSPGFGMTVRNLPSFPPFRMLPLETPCNSSTNSLGETAVIKVFPNPAIDIFSITCSSVIHAVEVYSLDGVDVLNVTLLDYQDHYEFSLENWPAGVYVVVCRDRENRTIGTKKLVKI